MDISTGHCRVVVQASVVRGEQAFPPGGRPHVGRRAGPQQLDDGGIHDGAPGDHYSYCIREASSRFILKTWSVNKHGSQVLEADICVRAWVMRTEGSSETDEDSGEGAAPTQGKKNWGPMRIDVDDLG